MVSWVRARKAQSGFATKGKQQQTCKSLVLLVHQLRLDVGVGREVGGIDAGLEGRLAVREGIGVVGERRLLLRLELLVLELLQLLQLIELRILGLIERVMERVHLALRLRFNWMRDGMSYTMAMQPSVKSNKNERRETTTREGKTRGALCRRQRSRLNQPTLPFHATLPRLLESAVGSASELHHRALFAPSWH